MMTAFARTIILYFLIMVGLRLMGKRQIGELEPSELVLTMMISDLATVPMQDFGIPLLAGVIPILTLLSISMLLSQISLRHLRFRAMVCGTPSVLIRNGELQQDAMRRNRYTLDELLEELRGQGISDISEVKYAVLENSGQLCVFPWAAQKPPTASQLGLKVEDDVTLPVILINDGRVLTNNLALCGKDDAWLNKTLRKEKLSSPREVFLLTLDEQGQVLCVKKEGQRGNGTCFRRWLCWRSFWPSRSGTAPLSPATPSGGGTSSNRRRNWPQQKTGRLPLTPSQKATRTGAAVRSTSTSSPSMTPWTTRRPCTAAPWRLLWSRNPASSAPNWRTFRTNSAFWRKWSGSPSKISCKGFSLVTSQPAACSAPP